MSFDRWERWHDGTLRNDAGTIWITRVEGRKPRWRVDGRRNERVPEYPEDKPEGWRRVEFTLGISDTLSQAKHKAEMHLRSRGGSDPRGTRADWQKVEHDLRERIDRLAWEVREGFWNDVVVGRVPGFMEPGWSFFSRASDMEAELRDLANDLSGIADKARKRRSHEEKIAKLENTTGRTPEEAASYRRKAAEMRSASE